MRFLIFNLTQYSTPDDEARKLVFLAGFVITLAIRFYFARRAKQNKKVVDSRVTAQEKVLLSLSILGMLVLPLANVFTSWFDFAAYNLPDWTGWLVLLYLD